MGQRRRRGGRESQQLIRHGRAAEAVDLLRTVAAPSRGRSVQLLFGDAYRTNGDFAQALAAYREVDDRGGEAPIRAAVAWRLGQIHQQQGEPRRALEVYGRADLTEADAVDHAWLLTNVATAYWLLGDADQALAHARAAGARATIAADPQVRAAAHVAMALSVSLSGDPATVEEEYARAAGCAADAGDLVQLAQINAKRSHHLLADARFAEAVDVAAAAGAAAEQFGSRRVLFVALVNEAEGLLRLGRCDEAVQRCERALALAGQIGTRRTAYALVGLAQIHLRRGWREQARAALEQALRLQGEEPDRQVRVPALAGLAITLLPEDVAYASELAEQALREADGFVPVARVAGRRSNRLGPRGRRGRTLPRRTGRRARPSTAGARLAGRGLGTPRHHRRPGSGPSSPEGGVPDLARGRGRPRRRPHSRAAGSAGAHVGSGPARGSRSPHPARGGRQCSPRRTPAKAPRRAGCGS